MLLSQTYLLDEKIIDKLSRNNSFDKIFNNLHNELINWKKYVKDLNIDDKEFKTLYYFINESFMRIKNHFLSCYNWLKNNIKNIDYEFYLNIYKEHSKIFDKNWNQLLSIINKITDNQEDKKTIKFNCNKVYGEFNDNNLHESYVNSVKESM